MALRRCPETGTFRPAPVDEPDLPPLEALPDDPDWEPYGDPMDPDDRWYARP